MDVINVALDVHVKKAYKNLSKHKRILTPVIESQIRLNINDQRIYEDEIFLETVFLKSFSQSGKYPMFTCACGIFGCVGYGVEVRLDQDKITWVLEEPFLDNGEVVYSTFQFSWENMLETAESIIQFQHQLNDIYHANGFERPYDCSNEIDYAFYFKLIRKE